MFVMSGMWQVEPQVGGPLTWGSLAFYRPHLHLLLLHLHLLFTRLSPFSYHMNRPPLSTTPSSHHTPPLTASLTQTSSHLGRLRPTGAPGHPQARPAADRMTHMDHGQTWADLGGADPTYDTPPSPTCSSSTGTDI